MYQLINTEAFLEWLSALLAELEGEE